MDTKRCPQCGETKPLDEFYRNKHMADGRSSYCKVCWSGRMKEYRANPETREAALAKRRADYQSGANKRKEQTRLRSATPEERAKRAAYAKTEAGKRGHNTAQRNYYYKDPRRSRAKKAVAKAIKLGQLPHISQQKCAECGAQAVEYHHHSYEPDHWVDVIPLCKICHAKTYTNPL